MKKWGSAKGEGEFLRNAKLNDSNKIERTNESDQ